MSEAQLIFRFPGVENVVSGTFSIGHGETPGVCVLSITPQDRPPAMFGTLTLSFDGNTYSWKDCRIVSASYHRDGSGRIVALQVEDWRWKWKTGIISGRYNRRENAARSLSSAPPIIAHTEKTVRELAQLCFEAMGEKSFDVSAMPDGPRPEVDWDGILAAQALAELCDLVGCRVVPMPDNANKVCVSGQGGQLPEGPAMTDRSDGFDPPEKPDGILLEGGPAEFQHDFELEAVAEETTGEFVLLDKVSYKPKTAGGWAGADIGAFNCIADIKTRKLAQGSAFRCYRVVIPKDGLDLPGYTELTEKKIKRADQLVFLNRQVETEVQHGLEVHRNAWVYGAFTDDATVGDGVGANTLKEPQPIVDPDSEMAKKCLIVDAGSYDQEKGVLTMSRTLVMKDDKELSAPAKLRYRCAVHVRDEKTDALHRYERKRDYGTKTGTKPLVIRREEITFRTVPFYDSKFKVTKTARYIKDSDKEADYYLDMKEKEWQNLTPSEATYAWIVPLKLDGAIQHVVYSGGSGQPATTRISRNSEMKQYTTPYRERRQREAVKAIIARPK